MDGIQRIRVALAAIAVVGAVSPFTVSPAGEIATKKAACADGTCCTEEASVCFINGIRTDNAYFKGVGSCKTPDA